MGKKSKATQNGKSEDKISIGELMRSMDHARWDHPLVMKAFRVMKELNTWLEGQYADPEDTPLVSIVVSAPIVSLLIGDDCVWENQCCSEEDLTLDFCKQEMKRAALLRMVPFE